MHWRQALPTLALLGAAAAAVGTGRFVPAQAAPPAATAAASIDTSGEQLYRAHCATCHEAPTDSRVPARKQIAQNPPSFIFKAQKTGVMMPMAQGLSTEQMLAIARYLSARPESEVDDVDPNLIWGDSVEGTPLDAPRCASAPRPVDLGAAAQWNGWSPTKDNARYQRHPGFAAADVQRLKLKWVLQYPGAKNGQATVVGDRLFTTSMSGAVYALDAKTGCVHWRYAGPAATRSSVTVAKVRYRSRDRNAIFISDWTKSVVALDAETGKPLWKTIVDDQPGLQMTAAPAYWKGRLFVPISSGNEAFAQSPNWVCCKFRGALVALDAASGRILWKRYTTEEVPHPFKKNAAGKDMWGPSGGAIWTTPTIDAKRGALYVGTSNSYTELPYDNSDSVLSIDIATGRILWAKQLTANDNYIDGCYGNPSTRPANCPTAVGPDWSIGASPILQQTASGSDILLVGQKSGVLWALDPARRGAVVWAHRLSRGSELGGIEFATAADGKRVYAGVSDIVLGKRGEPALWALDITTGDVVWHQPMAPTPSCRWQGMWCHGAISQAISVMPGLVFAGSYDGHFRAFDTATGEIRWDFDTGTDPVRALNGDMALGGVMDGAGPTIAGGMVYVHSGYAGRSTASGGRGLRNADGNILMAFSIDGK